jgi:hypothetical protein
MPSGVSDRTEVGTADDELRAQNIAKDIPETKNYRLLYAWITSWMKY